MDVAFNLSGTIVTGCTASGDVIMFDVATKKEIGEMEGHGDQEISRVVFSPSGSRVLTASADKTARSVFKKWLLFISSGLYKFFGLLLN